MTSTRWSASDSKRSLDGAARPRFSETTSNARSIAYPTVSVPTFAAQRIQNGSSLLWARLKCSWQRRHFELDLRELLGGLAEFAP